MGQSGQTGAQIAQLNLACRPAGVSAFYAFHLCTEEYCGTLMAATFVRVRALAPSNGGAHRSVPASACEKLIVYAHLHTRMRVRERARVNTETQSSNQSVIAQNMHIDICLEHIFSMSIAAHAQTHTRTRTHAHTADDDGANCVQSSAGRCTSFLCTWQMPSTMLLCVCARSQAPAPAPVPCVRVSASMPDCVRTCARTRCGRLMNGYLYYSCGTSWQRTGRPRRPRRPRAHARSARRRR